MISRQRFSRLLALLVVVSLFLVACERPFPRDEETSEPDSAGQVDTGSQTEDSGYPGDSGDTGDAGDTGDTGDDAGYPGDGGDTGDTGDDAGYPGDGGDGDVGGDPGDGGDDDVGGGAPGDGGDTGDSGDTGDDGDDGDTGDDSGDTGDTGDTGDDSGDTGDTGDTSDDSGDTGDTGDEEDDSDTGDTSDDSGDTGDDSGDTGDTGDTAPVFHTVQAGENLYRIGLQYGISWLEIARLNNLAPPYTIKVGQQLQISEGTVAPPPDDEDTTSYVVQAGDNLFRIGLQFGIGWRQIAEANGIVNPSSLRAGQVLKIPTATPGPGTEFNHTVQAGETLFRISLQYGVSWQAIAERNNIESPYVIYAGETLIIPSN